MYTCTPTDTHTCTYTKTEVNSVISRASNLHLYNESFRSFPYTIGIFTWQAAYTDVKRKIFKIRPLNTTVWIFSVLYDRLELYENLFNK